MAEELKIVITADDKASAALKGTKTNLVDLGQIAGGALKIGLGAAAMGATALAAGLFTSVGAASGAENVMADLDATLKSTAAGLAAQADAVPRMSEEAGKAMAEIAKEHASGISDVMDAAAEKAAQFTDKMNELAESHAERQADIQGRLGELNSDFNDQMKESARALNEQLAELSDRHAEREATLREQIADLNDGYDERRKDRQEQLQDKLASIEERTLDQQKALSDKLNETTDKTVKAKLAAKIKELNEEAAKEKEKAEARAKEEEARAKKEQDKRLARLQEQINKENAEYAKQTAKLKADADREAARDREKHARRLADLQGALDKENSEYTKQTNRLKAEQAKQEADTREHMAKVEAAYSEGLQKIGDKFTAIERGITLPAKVEQMSREALVSLAEGLQKVTPFEDDVVLKGEAMLLTFTQIGKNVFPEATEAMLNMGQKFGSVDAAAVQLGKALNDPIGGVTALRKVGVMLTDQQEEQIKKYMALGDVESAQKVILGELNTEFGGLARAAGETFAGKLAIAENKLGDVSEKIGGAVLPGLTNLADGLIKTLDNPVVIKAIDSITNWLATELPKAIEAGSGLLKDLQEKGLTGVLSQAQAWVNDPVTQKMLQDAGAKAGEGIVGGISAAVTSIPMWADLGMQIGKVAIPIMVQTGAGIGAGLINGLLDSLGIKGKVGIGNVPKLPGFASGGMVPGPMGMPQLAVVHGGETITPAGGGGGGFGGLTFVYAPTISLADEVEAQSRIAPVLDRWWKSVNGRRG